MLYRMSLETLLEAARYVEQQELRAKQLRMPLLSPTPSLNSSHGVPPAVTPVPIPATVPSPVVPLTVAPATQTTPLSPVNVIPITNIHSLVDNIVQKGEQDIKEVLKLSPHHPATSPKPSDSPPHEKSGLGTVSNVLGAAAKAPRPALPGTLRLGTREVHNKLEKNRRAHLKECFEILKKQLPPQQDEKKSSNLSILHSALRFIQLLKKKERENEHEMERLAREKISAQQRLASLKKDLGYQWENIDFSNLMPTEPPALPVKEERTSSDGEENVVSRVNTQIQPAQLSVHMPLTQVVGQGLVVGLHKVALVAQGKSLPIVSSPVTHIITAPSQLNGKVVPLMNAQYLMKPVVVVSTPSGGPTALSPRPS